MSKRWITYLLVFCLVLGNLAPAAGAVSFGPSNGAGGSGSGIFGGLVDAAEKLLGISLRDDKSHLQKLDENVLSLVDGKWVATTADGKQIPLTEAQLPKHIQVLRKAAGQYQPMDMVTAFVVLSPIPRSSPVVVEHSHATRHSGSIARIASRTASDTPSHNLSGCPSVTDSDVKNSLILYIQAFEFYLYIFLNSSCRPASSSKMTAGRCI